MTEIRTLCAFAVAVGLLAVPWASAAEPLRGAAAAFNERDRNGDGKLSQAESGMPADIFSRSDVDGDGLLTSREYERGPVGPPGVGAPSQRRPRRPAAPSRATPPTRRSSQTTPQVSAAEIILAVFDTNRNGFLTRREMLATFKALDKNNDGALSKEEIAASKAAASLARARAREGRRSEMRAPSKPSRPAARKAGPPPASARTGGADADFSRMDQNRDGRLSPDEWGLLMPPDNFSSLDADNDGSISKEEYRGQR